MVVGKDETLQYPPSGEVIEPVEYPRKGYYVEVSVEKVYGCCPQSVEGDKYNYVGFNAMEPGLCGIAEHSIHQYIVGMCIGTKAVDMGIAKDGEDGYVMCPAWGPPTCEAQVIFKLHPVAIEKMPLDEWYEALAQMGHHSVPSYFRENFLPGEAKEAREAQIKEWEKAGRPKFWEGWRNMPAQQFISENKDFIRQAMRESMKEE
jgi:uncharacterized repeat protein (TIGR04076 family)